MEQRTLVAGIGALLLSLIALAILSSTVQFVKEPSGYFRIAVRESPAQTGICYDTDGGTNWFEQGATRYLDWSFTDACSIIVNETANTSILYEGYCASPQTPVIAMHECYYGCEDGACII
jgi:hypothetical protein